MGVWHCVQVSEIPTGDGNTKTKTVELTPRFLLLPEQIAMLEIASKRTVPEGGQPTA
jgi:hypothetical protein